MPSNMFASMVNSNGSVYTGYTEGIANIQCHLLLKYWRMISTTETRKYCWCLWYNLLLLIYYCYENKNSQHSMLANIDNKTIFYKSLIKINDSKRYWHFVFKSMSLLGYTSGYRNH